MASEGSGHTPQVTQLLLDWRAGRREARDELVPLVYQELRRVAAAYLRKEGPGHILQPTALVNELCIKVMGVRSPDWRNRAHFVAVAANMMRQILVDYARQQRAAKRDFGQQVTLDERAALSHGRPVDLLALNDALDRLSERDERKAKVIELRYFGGLDLNETAEAMGVAVSTVRRDVALAQSWLRRELNS